MIRLAVVFIPIVFLWSCATKTDTESTKSYEDYFPPIESYQPEETPETSYDSQSVDVEESWQVTESDFTDDSPEVSESDFIDTDEAADNIQEAKDEPPVVKKSVCKAKPAPGPKKIGKPYYVAGIKYYPLETADGYSEEGVASWYGPGFHGKLTANGEKYNQRAMTAAHKTLPMPTYVRVKNLENGKEVIVRVNDRGPFSKGRIIDLSHEAAKRLDMLDKGTAKVRVTVLSEDSDCYVSDGKEVDLNSGSYAVQIASFSVENNAVELSRKLGSKAKVFKEYVNGVLWYRVWITGFTAKDQAENAAAEYDGEFPGAFVIAR